MRLIDMRTVRLPSGAADIPGHAESDRLAIQYWRAKLSFNKGRRKTERA